MWNELKAVNKTGYAKKAGDEMIDGGAKKKMWSPSSSGKEQDASKSCILQ